MRIAIVSSLLDPAYGGPATVVKAHAEALAPDCDVTVVGCAPRARLADVRALFPGAQVFAEAFPRRWFRGSGLADWMLANARRFDLLHVHMLWDHPTWATWRASRAASRPFVITPHGSVSSAWRTAALHKRIYRHLVLDRVVRDASAVHALNPAEARACREWGVDSRIEIIPNGLPEACFLETHDPAAAHDRWPLLRGRRVMLYLGRLWGDKGLDALPEAWKQATPAPEWRLVIAGPDYRDYEAGLLRRIAALGLTGSVVVTGPVRGALKDSLLGASECLVLPSRSEGFSMAVLEAMAAGMPSILSTECHFPELAAAGGGWEIPIGIAALGRAIRDVCNRSQEELRSRGHIARELGRREYTLESVARRLTRLYSSILDKGFTEAPAQCLE